MLPRPGRIRPVFCAADMAAGLLRKMHRIKIWFWVRKKQKDHSCGKFSEKLKKSTLTFCLAYANLYSG